MGIHFIEASSIPRGYSAPYLVPELKLNEAIQHNKKTYTLLGNSKKSYTFGSRIWVGVCVFAKTVFSLGLGLFFATTREDLKSVFSGKKIVTLYTSSKSLAAEILKDQIDAATQSNLGVECEERKDYVGALKHYEQAAKKGNAIAEFNLGSLYFQGRGVDLNVKKAFEYYEQAAEKGYVIAESNLGFLYLGGRGVKQSNKKAFEYYERAAEKGYAVAESELGSLYLKGRGVKQSNEKAFTYFQRAANQNLATAQFALGGMYLGCMRCKGDRRVEKSDEKAFTCFQQAADQNLAMAQNQLGWMYGNGRGVEQKDQNENDKQAVKYYQLAADQYYAIAQYNLGLMYKKGLGVNKDETEAFRLFGLAANQGYERAQREIDQRKLLNPETAVEDDK